MSWILYNTGAMVALMTISDVRTGTLQSRVRSARLFAGLEQGDLATACGVSRQSVSSWETGRAMMPATALIMWAETTRVSLDWIAWGNVRPEGFEPPTY